MLLPEPYEYLDLHDGESMMLSIDRFQDGSAVIHPTDVTPRHVRIHMEQRGLDAPPAPGTPISVEVPVIRVFGVRLDKPERTAYWDVSSKRLRAELLMTLTPRTTWPVVLTLTAHGAKRLKRYSVEG
jgi:hypothetical protein